MAKAKPTLLAAAKTLPKGRCGNIPFEARLTPEQLKDFNATVAWYRTQPEDERPTQKDMLVLFRKELKFAPTREKFRELIRAK